jgi:hypothetical protein
VTKQLYEVQNCCSIYYFSISFCQESQKEIEKLQVSYDELKESCHTISRHTGNNKVPRSPSANKSKTTNNAFRDDHSSYFPELISVPATRSASTGEVEYEEDNTLLDELDEDNGLVPSSSYVDTGSSQNPPIYGDYNNLDDGNLQNVHLSDNYYGSVDPRQSAIMVDTSDENQEARPLSYVVLDIDLENNMKDQLIVTTDSDPMVSIFLLFLII